MYLAVFCVFFERGDVLSGILWFLLSGLNVSSCSVLYDPFYSKLPHPSATGLRAVTSKGRTRTIDRPPSKVAELFVSSLLVLNCT